MGNNLVKVLKDIRRRVKKNNGLIRTRFPPEPSGYLHIGHLKAVLLNSFVSSSNFSDFQFKHGEETNWPTSTTSNSDFFTSSITSIRDMITMNDFSIKFHNDKLIIPNLSTNFKDYCENKKIEYKAQSNLHFRFDDTNPDKGSIHYQDSIVSDLIKFNVFINTCSFSSQYFIYFIELAKLLLKGNKAYIDLDTPEQIKEKRKASIASEYRNVPPTVNLTNFMENKGCLRIKFDMESKNGSLRDPVIMRTNQNPHYCSGNAFKWYPCYDFICPILDFIEGIDIALRTTEYLDRHESYFKVLEVCSDFVVTPKSGNNTNNTGVDGGEEFRTLEHADRSLKLMEYSRLNMAKTLISKRKLKRLIEINKQKPGNVGLVDWEDPRAPTLKGLKNRGIKDEALRKFIGINMFSENVNLNEWDKLFFFNKSLVINDALRLFAVNKEGSFECEIKGCEKLNLEFPWVPKNKEKGQRFIDLKEKVLLNKSDFENLEELKENKKLINLVGVCNFVVKEVENGEIKELIESDSKDFKNAIKVSWVSGDTVGVKVVRLGNVLVKDKITKESDWEDAINYKSWKEETWVGEKNFRELKCGSYIEIMREGLFYVKRGFDESTNCVEVLALPDGKVKARKK